MKKFTLIELLVVVAIIGILASLLLPSLGKARDKGKAAVCVSNLKQIGLSFSMYAENNDFYAPLASAPTSSGTTRRLTWDDFLAGYDGRDALTTAEMNSSTIQASTNGEGYGAVYRCPSDESISDHGGNTDILGRSYAITRKKNNITPDVRWLGIAGENTSLNFNNLNDAESTILLAEHHDRSNYLGNASSRRDTIRPSLYMSQDALGLTPHNDKANFLMADGHVEKNTAIQTLVSSDGSMSTVSDVTGSMWDATK